MPHLARSLCAGLVLVVGATLAAVTARAHPGDKGYATITLLDSMVRYQYLLPLSSFHPSEGNQTSAGAGLARNYRDVADAVGQKVIIALDGAHCARGAMSMTPPADPSGSIGVLAEFTCQTDRPRAAPRQLTIRDDLVDALAPEYVTIASIQWPGGSRQHVFKGDARELRLDLEDASTAQGVVGFFLLGVEHILLGWDHLLFVLALLLQGGTCIAVLKVITAFTVAHSLTLAAAVLDLVVVPSRLVESVIALSIAYVAGMSLLRSDESGWSRRWPVAFGFGLVHGLGFSGALRESGLPGEGLLWALFGFNVGVEAGQAAVVAIVLPAIWLAAKTSRWPLFVRMAATTLVVIGLIVFVLRLAA